MRTSFRKMIVQVGVVLFIAGMLPLMLEPFLYLAGTLLLFVAAILPRNKQDEWGSMWPLVGYDNAIDAIYVRGPWLLRFQELEEMEVQSNITAGLVTLFDEHDGQRT